VKLVFLCLLASILLIASRGIPSVFPGDVSSTGKSSVTPVNISAERLDDRLIVRIDGKTFTVYRFGSGQKYPYFYPVNGPLSGQSLTTESSLPYPHHRSLFFGCDRVNGGNYWQEGNELGQILSHGPRVIKNGPDEVVWSDECDWRKPGEEPVIRDQRRVHVSVPSSELRLIDFAIELQALTRVHIEKTNHSLFSARVADSLSVKEGGTLVNAAGAAGEKNTFGQASPWMDYSGINAQYREGIAIFDSPRNRWYPSPWFTRDYGFFSPTPMEWLGTEGLSLKQGESISLSYRVVVHGGDAKGSRLANLFAEWDREQKK
jgi:hypothetical protein